MPSGRPCGTRVKPGLWRSSSTGSAQAGASLGGRRWGWLRLCGRPSSSTGSAQGGAWPPGAGRCCGAPCLELGDLHGPPRLGLDGRRRAADLAGQRRPAIARAAAAGIGVEGRRLAGSAHRRGPLGKRERAGIGGAIGLGVADGPAVAREMAEMDGERLLRRAQARQPAEKGASASAPAGIESARRPVGAGGVAGQRQDEGLGAHGGAVADCEAGPR